MNEILHYATRYGILLLQLLVAFLILKFIFSSTLKDYHSRWNTLIDDFNYSSEDFYNLLKEDLDSNGVEGITITFAFLKEGGAFSSSRTYLRISWKNYQYDICAAPFGNGFFISWWMLYKNSLGKIIISKIPFVGSWLASKLYPVTYYKIDTASMFMSYAQSSVLRVIDKITKEKGVRLLSENERKPILQDIFKR